MGCCASRDRGTPESLPTVDEETEVSAEVAQNLKDVPEANVYLTSSDEDQDVVPPDRRPRLSLIPIVTNMNNDATRISNNTSASSPSNALVSADIIDTHMGINRADSISTDRRRSQWEAVALTVAAKRRSQDFTNRPERTPRVSWSPTAGSGDRKRKMVEKHGRKTSPHRNHCLADIGTCPAAEDEG